MKRTLVLLTASLAALLLPWACKKPDGPKGPKTEVTIAISDIAIQTATVSITATGDTPALVRMVEAVPLEAVLAEIGSLEDEEALKTYLTRNGVAAVLPYSSAAQNLTPSTEYLVGAICFDANMDPIGVGAVTFTTLDAGSLVIGGGSGAGSVTENTLD